MSYYSRVVLFLWIQHSQLVYRRSRSSTNVNKMSSVTNGFCNAVLQNGFLYDFFDSKSEHSQRWQLGQGSNVMDLFASTAQPGGLTGSSCLLSLYL